MTGVTDLDLGVSGIVNDRPANGVAYRMFDGVTDLGSGMPSILNDSPANEFAYQVTDVVLTWIGVC